MATLAPNYQSDSRPNMASRQDRPSVAPSYASGQPLIPRRAVGSAAPAQPRASTARPQARQNASEIRNRRSTKKSSWFVGAPEMSADSFGMGMGGAGIIGAPPDVPANGNSQLRPNADNIRRNRGANSSWIISGVGSDYPVAPTDSIYGGVGARPTTYHESSGSGRVDFSQNGRQSAYLANLLEEHGYDINRASKPEKKWSRVFSRGKSDK